MIQPLALNPLGTSTILKPAILSMGITPPVLNVYNTHATVAPNFGYSMHAIGDTLPVVNGPAGQHTTSTFQRLNILA
jgi:hypothetical protein